MTASVKHACPAKSTPCESWEKLEEASEQGEVVIGIINGKVKGGSLTLTTFEPSFPAPWWIFAHCAKQHTWKASRLNSK